MVTMVYAGHSYPSGMSGSCDQLSMSIAGATVTQRHYDKAVKLIQEAHNDSIGAPKVYIYALVYLLL